MRRPARGVTRARLRRMARHDRFFRAILSDPGALEAIVRERLPGRLVRDLRGPPVALPEHFVDDALRDNIADLVVSLPLRGAPPMLAACLIEHVRAPERRLLLQILR